MIWWLEDDPKGHSDPEFFCFKNLPYTLILVAHLMPFILLQVQSASLVIFTKCIFIKYALCARSLLTVLLYNQQ